MANAPPCGDGMIASAHAGEPCAERSKPVLLAVTIIGSGMAFLDSAVVGVALPVIGRDLDADLSLLQWVVNAYVLASAALTLVGGAAGDRFGRRRIFLLGMALFAAASLACGLAPGAVALIAARAAQGIGAALMVPSSLAIIGATFGAGEKGRAIGTWAAATSVTGALGPVLGGWLADTVSWRAIFFVNLPFAVIVLPIARLALPESRDSMAPPRLDWPGAVLVACGLAGSAYALIQSSELGWADPTVLLAAAAGVLGIGAFMVVEAVSAAPMVPLDLFRSRRFSGINLLTLFLYAALAGGFFLLPFDLIRAQGYSAAEAGAASLPVPLLLTALSRWSGGLLDRLGDRPPLIIGPLVTAAGFLFLAVKGTDGLYWSSVFPAMMIIGIGMAVSVAPLTAAVMSAVPERQVGVASGVNNAVADIAALLAVSVFGVIALAVFGHVLDRDIAGLGASVDVAQAAAAIGKTLGGSNLPVSLPVDQRAALEGAIAAAFSATFRIVMLGTAGLAALSAACAAAMVAAKSR